MVAVVVATQLAPPVRAWGRLGHRLTARLAERDLTPQAKAAMAALLEPGESLADASMWADEHKRLIRGSAPWHYVDVPLDEPRYDARFSGPEATKGCIVDRFREFQAVLRDSSRPVQERRFALRFLVGIWQRFATKWAIRLVGARPDGRDAWRGVPSDGDSGEPRQ